MSKKLYIGIIAGVLIGISVPVIIKFRKEEELFADEDLSDENDMLDKANHYLLLARNKVDEMVSEASKKSTSILEEAGKILSSAKVKTAALHYDKKESVNEAVEKIKKEIEESIEELEKKIGNS